MIFQGGGGGGTPLDPRMNAIEETDYYCPYDFIRHQANELPNQWSAEGFFSHLAHKFSK